MFYASEPKIIYVCISEKHLPNLIPLREADVRLIHE